MKSIAAGLLLLCVPFAAVAFDSSALPGPGPAPAFTAVGGTVTQPVVLTGDNSGGTGTLRIRPSDEDTQLVLCEASNNAATEVCSSWQHYNSSTIASASFFATNLYLDSASASHTYANGMGTGYFQTSASTTGGAIYMGVRHPLAADNSVNYTFRCQSTGATTATCYTGDGHTVTSDIRGPITNGGSATCNGYNAGFVCVPDGVAISGSNATLMIHATDATTYASNQYMNSSGVVVGNIGHYGASFTDADYADKVTVVGVSKTVSLIRTDDVAAGTAAVEFRDAASATGVLLGDIDGAGRIRPLLYGSQTDCTDNAGAAACGAAPTGAVVLDDGSTTVVVSTTAVTANSTIDVSFDPSLGTKLGITCNTTQVFPYVSARTAATSFTITSADPAGTNKACFSYSIVN